jgi:murein DD-endopeptidase MepM/ murein hydrolase activator NlpD
LPFQYSRRREAIREAAGAGAVRAPLAKRRTAAALAGPKASAALAGPRARAPLAASAAAALGCLLAAVPASGAGTSAASGGTAYVGRPEIVQVRCASGCAHGKVQGGGAVKLRGRNFSYARKVVFLGGAGRGDDVAVRVRATSDRKLEVKVPFAARSGPLAALASASVRSRPTPPVRIVPPPPPEPTGRLSPASGPSDPGAPRLETAVNRGTLFFDAAGGVVFTYRVEDGGPVSASLDLVRLADGFVVQTWTAEGVAPGQVQTVRWDGRAGGVPQPDGRYAFRLAVRSAGGAVSRSVPDGEATRDAFELRGHVFPVRGRHDYGNAGARFGAGRSGHSHEGQDVMARCGTRLVAARGGVVEANKVHSAAGNYVVIDGEGTDVDYMYAHLVSPSPFRVGDRVHTGQQIGEVGDTGNAQGCHLHFELWAGPGWYSGGAPFDPLADLKAWDAYS